ncbi:MAG: TIGR02300 family protein [Parvularculaceae bacterium]
MANEDLGVKRDCPECGARFYDLSNDPALCPKCAHEFTPEVILKPRRTRKEEEAAAQTDEEEKKEEDEEEEEKEDKSEVETSLDEADETNVGAPSKRKASLDDDDDDDDEESDDEVPDLEGIEVDVDDADDESLLDNEEEENIDLGVPKPSKDNE